MSLAPHDHRIEKERVSRAADARFRTNCRLITDRRATLSMDQLSDVLTAISHPSRRAIIGQLAAGPARFTDIAKPFDLSLNAITKHLKLLERAGLISREKQGREVLISFRPEPLRLVSGWVHEYEQFWSERLDQFEGFFKEKRKKSHETRDEDD
jgi:DNA-binding transcriptional ArsR family regulator